MPAPPRAPVDGYYVTARGHRIAAGAVTWSATRSGGPGGQHANRADSAVTITIDIATARLPADVGARVMAALGPTVVASSARSRSQWRNRQLAWAEAVTRLDAASAPPEPPRNATRPTRAARERRLHSKRVVADRKRSRRQPPPPEGE